MDDSANTARLFVAIPIDDAVRKSMRPIDWWVDHLDRFRKIPPTNRHVTVAFIGDVAEAAIKDITGALDHCLAKRRPFVMPVIGIASMPNDHRQRAIAVDLDATTGFSDLAIEVRTALLATPARDRILDQPERAPRPHITVARKKRTGGGSRVDLSDAPILEGSISCVRVDLVRSALGPQGPIYTALASWPFHGSAEC